MNNQHANEQPENNWGKINIVIEPHAYSVAPGSSITIPLKIKFSGDGVESFLLRVVGIPSDWVYIPQPVMQFNPGEQKDVAVTVQPPAAPRGQVGRYPLNFEISSQLNPDTKSTAQVSLVVAAYEVHGDISVLVESTRYTVPPGGETTIRLVLRNQGFLEDTFKIKLEGIPVEWISGPAHSITLAEGAQGEVTFRIQAPPSPPGRAGRYPFTIRITGQDDPDQAVEIGATLTIAAYEVTGRIGVLMAGTQYAVQPGEKVSIPLVLLNQGLTEDHFKLSVEGVPVNWVSTASPITYLAPGDQKEVVVEIQPPRHAQSRAGRNSLVLAITSQQAPDQKAEVECVLTVATFTQFRSELRPVRIESNQNAQVIIENQSNIQENFSVLCKADEQELEFSPSEAQNVRVPPGQVSAVQFQAQPRRRPLFGGEHIYPYSVTVASSDGSRQTRKGEVSAKALIPFLVIPILVVLCVGLTCILGYLVIQRQSDRSGAVQATQTAAANQTAAAIIGEEDTDGDGLTNREELEWGTDPTNPDSDSDQLQDGPEVKQYGTDPLNPDTDGDRLSDGDEIQRGTDPLSPDSEGDRLNDGDEVERGTDPLNPDSDSDGLGDGDEVERGTDPLEPDSDEDKLFDGPEIQLGTDPLNPDTDRDRLIDGEENLPCPDPLNPDSDADGIIDGEDLDPCDPSNPSLTASAVPPSSTPVPPTVPPTGEPTEPVGNPGAGKIAFESNRGGNADIYILDTQSLEVARLTNEPAVDTQPAWSPDGSKIAFASDRSGNFDIYVMNSDGSNVQNITNNEIGDDLHPAWSPDGNWIAFSTDRDGNREIYSIQVDGPGIHNLSNSPDSEEYQPHWFESGGILFSNDMIVFTSERDGNPEIYRMNPDGSDQVRLTNNPAADYSPNGSPQGNQIAFITERDGNPEVYLMDIDGGNPQNLSQSPAAELHPAWRPDGDWIAFTTNRDGIQEIYAILLGSAQPLNLSNNPSEDLYPAWK
jgi:uncharacterized membrane protein